MSPSCLEAVPANSGCKPGHFTFSKKVLGREIYIEELSSPWRLEIRASNFAQENTEHWQWFLSRRMLGKNPLGERSFWAERSPIQPYYPDMPFSMFPEIFDKHEFRATLSFEKPDPREWAKLGYILGQDEVVDVIVQPLIWDFLQRMQHCFPTPNFDESVYGKKAQSDLKKFLSNTRENLLNDKQRLVVKALEEGIQPPKPKLRYYGTPVGPHPLFITHASTEFGPGDKVKAVYERMIKKAKLEGRPVIYLRQDDNALDMTQYLDAKDADYIMLSGEGEHSFIPSTGEITVAGNFFGLCQGTTIADAITRYFLGKESGELTVHVPLNSSLAHGQDTDFQQMTMREVLETSGPERVKELVKKYFLQEKQFGVDDDTWWGPAPDYRAIKVPNSAISYDDYYFEFLLDNRPLISKGNNRKRKIIIRLTSED